MNRAAVLRQRRCRLLQLAMLFGILLPIFSWSWITLGAAIIGEAVLGFTWWRECRRGEGPGDAFGGPGPTSGSGPHS